MRWIVSRGHWFLLLVVCFSVIKDLTTSTHISVKVLSILCLLAAIFVVLTIEKGRKKAN